jgi:hypothetical protein
MNLDNGSTITVSVFDTLTGARTTHRSGSPVTISTELPSTTTGLYFMDLKSTANGAVTTMNPHYNEVYA